MGSLALPLAAAAFWAGLLAWRVLPEGASSAPGTLWLLLATVSLACAWWGSPRGVEHDALADARLSVAPSATMDRVTAVRTAGGRPALAVAGIGVAMLVLGIWWGAVAEARREASLLGRLAPRTVQATGVLREDPRPGTAGWHALVSLRHVAWSEGAADLRETVWVSGDEAPAAVRGDVVQVAGSLEVPDDAGFAGALEAKGLAVTLRASEITRVGPATNPFVRATQSVRRVVGASIERVLPEREAGLLLGLALGDDSELDPATERDFRATGLTHLLVVSGGNVAMLLAPMLLLARALGLARVGTAVVGITIVAFIVILTGAEPSVLRAGTMTGLALIGVLLGKPRTTTVVLAAAVLVLLVLDPSLATSVGFQLSTAATGGLVTLASPLGERLSRVVPRPVALAVGTTLAAQLGVTPVLLFHFGDVPLVTLLANVIAAPAVAPSLLLGLVAAGVGLVAAPLGVLLGLAAQLPMRYLELVANVMGKAPVAHITSEGGPLVLAGSLAFVVAVAVAITTGWRPPRTTRLAALCLLPVAVWSSAATKGWPDGLTVRFFDVGQGDAALLTTPSGAAVLIDGGPEEDDVAIELAALGIKRLDAVVASHPHADHIVGLPSVLARIPVGMVLQPGCPSDSPLQADLDGAIADESLPEINARAGDVFTIGDLRIDVLSPDRCWMGTESDPNNDAFVLRASIGDDVVLVASECEEPAQGWLLGGAVDLTADVLKVPHHGAATSLPEFFQAVAAPVAVVSVGENDYGHPVASTLDAIAAAGSAIWRTDQHGTITVAFEGGVPTVVVER